MNPDTRGLALGDRVIVIRGCPVCDYGYGKIYVIAQFVFGPRYSCGQCGTTGIAPASMGALWEAGRPHGAPVGWLKKLDGLDDVLRELDCLEAEFNRALVREMVRRIDEQIDRALTEGGDLWKS